MHLWDHGHAEAVEIWTGGSADLSVPRLYFPNEGTDAMNYRWAKAGGDMDRAIIA